MNKFGLTDTSIIDAIGKHSERSLERHTVPYLVMKVGTVGPVRFVVNRVNGETYPMFTFILKNKQNQEERIIEANVFAEKNVNSFRHKIKENAVIAIKNAVVSDVDDHQKGNTPYSLKLISCAKILPMEDGIESFDEKEVFFMKLRYATSDQQLQRVRSHYEGLLNRP